MINANAANLTEAEALLQLSHCQESDEGIVSDQSSVADAEDPAAARRIKVRPQPLRPVAGETLYEAFFLWAFVDTKDDMRNSLFGK